MGFRIIILVAVAWLAYALIKRYIKNKQIERSAPKDKRSEKIIKCEKCSVHVPEHEAIRYQGRYYCSEEHKRLDIDN